jgi:hypothetical protein
MSANEDNHNESGFNSNPSSSPPDESDSAVIDMGALGPQLVLAPEDYPNVDDLITEDGAPMDSVHTEKQLRLLTEPLYSSWAGPGDGGTFVAMANVGLFFTVKRPPLVPDFLLSLDVEVPANLRDKNHRSYFLWEYGKMPEVILEMVSDRRGGEETLKVREYGRRGVLYYVIYDPDNVLKGGVLRVLELHGRRYEARPDSRLPEVGLGLTFWQGEYERANELWLRWCDQEGQLIPTGRERAEQAEQRAEQERQRAEQERQRAAEKDERLKRLEAQLRAMGIEPAE